MPWGKVDDNHYDHPKVLSIPRAIRNAADGLYWRAISRSNRTLSDGWLTDGDLDVIDSDPTLVDALVAAGLWERKADGRLRIHDYLAHNKSKAEVLKERRAKEEAGRAGGLASGRTRAKQNRKQTRSRNEAGASRLLEPNANGIEAPGVELPSRPVPSRPVRSGSIEPEPSAARIPDDAYDVMLKVEALTRRPFNYREGNNVHDTLIGDVTQHGAEAMSEHYARFQSENAGCDAAQLVFGVHNRLHPLIKAKPMTDAERKEAEIQAAIAQIKAETAGARA